MGETDTISRQVAIDAIRKHKTLYEADHGWDKTTLDALDTAIKALRQPERKTGRWGEHGECSYCGYLRQWEDDNFCANCGARMEADT